MSCCCENFTNTCKVGKCGAKLWLGTVANLTGNESLFVQYFLNGDEITEMTTPIIQGNDVFLDLTDPYLNFYSQYNTYYVWLSDSNGYYSDGTQIENNGLHDGFIINFGNVATTHDRLVVC